MTAPTVIVAQPAPVAFTVVPPVRTPLAPAEAVTRLKTYPLVNRANGPLLLALIWIETGAGNSSFGFNVGNIAAASSYQGQAWRPPWFEIGPDASPRLQELHARMMAGQAPSAFRSYSDFTAGFNDFISQLKISFPEVLAAAQTGDSAQFVQALSLKYSKDYGPQHVRSFETLRKQFEPLFSDLSAPVNTLPTGGRIASSGLGASLGSALLFLGGFLLLKAAR